MIEFDEAIKVAFENVTKLVKNAKNPELEGVLISENNKLYEVAISYEVETIKQPDDLLFGSRSQPQLFTLAKILGKRRETKVFLVDINSGSFRGFKNYKEA